MILVFAGKRVGAELLSYLSERPEPIEYVVAASAADENVLRICADQKLNNAVFSRPLLEDLKVSRRRFDWLLDLWSPHILPKEVLDLATFRANLHPSLVPHARGADSSAWTIRKGLPAGVSILEMTEVVDGGGLYVQQEVPFEFPMRGRALHDRLQDEMVALFKRAWPRMLSGEIVAKPQPTGGSHHRRKETNSDRVQSAEAMMSLGEAVTWMLAHDFHPGTTAELEHNGERYRLSLSISKIEP